MKIFKNQELRSLEDLLVNQLDHLYDAEKNILEALPKMAQAAHTPALKRAFVEHLDQTREHVDRLTKVFDRLKRTPGHETCEAIKGLLKEGEQMLDAKGDPDVIDAALIAAAQRVEHYEIADYGTARTFALRLGQTEVARLLQETLQEEKDADKKLTDVAENEVNVRAVH